MAYFGHRWTVSFWHKSSILRQDPGGISEKNDGFPAGSFPKGQGRAFSPGTLWPQHLVPQHSGARKAEGSQNESETLHDALHCKEGFPNMCFRWGFELIYRQWKIGQFGNPAISAKTRLSSGNAEGVGDIGMFPVKPLYLTLTNFNL